MESNDRGRLPIHIIHNEDPQTGISTYKYTDKKINPFYLIPPHIRERAIFGPSANIITRTQQRIKNNIDYLESIDRAFGITDNNRTIEDHLEDINIERFYNDQRALTHSEALDQYPDYELRNAAYNEFSRTYRNTQLLQREVRERQKEIVNWTADDKLNNLLLKISTTRIFKEGDPLPGGGPPVVINPNNEIVSVYKKQEEERSRNNSSSGSDVSSSGSSSSSSSSSDNYPTTISYGTINYGGQEHTL